MEAEKRTKIMIVLGIILIFVPILVQAQIDYKMRSNEKVIFYDFNGVKIFNTYYTGEKNAGIMIFHGFGEDQTSLDSYISKFQRLGFHVFATDFSGHGRSSGAIPSGDTSNYELAIQVLRAKTAFKAESGLIDSQIIMLGHSMGASAIMRAVTLDMNQVNGCILLGPALGGEEHTSTSNTWVSELNSTNPFCNICIITGKWDEVCGQTCARSLFNKLSGFEMINTDKITTQTIDGLMKSCYILSGLTHTYESLSLRAINWAASFAYETLITGNDSILKPVKITFLDYRAYIMIFELIGIFVTLIFGSNLMDHLNAKSKIELKNDETSNLLLKNPKKFLLYKLLFWLGGAVFALLIAIVIISLPINLPYFTLIFVCPLTGYGIMMLILFLVGKVPGIEGKWRPSFKSFKAGLTWPYVLFGVIISIIAIAILSYFVDSLIYHVFPINIRLAWLAVFTLMSTIGFFFQQLEQETLRNYPSKSKMPLTVYNNLLFLIPFILGALFLLFSGSITFFIDGFHDLIILGIIILIGNLLQKIWKKPILTAFVQSLLLFILLLPRGPLTFTTISNFF
ncbi:MAG: lysophospholipase [Asgard group archaeon]|nr:lysophospholipase [Asgard group archaeon]